MIIDAQHLYKEETGSFPIYETEMEYEIWRSKGQWIIEISDEEKFKLFGNHGFITIRIPEQEYIDWLENKIMELIKL